jgi:DNA-binding beta-propeller fold protein YncE
MRRFGAHVLTLAALAAVGQPAWAGVRATFLYPLSDSVGRMSFGWAPLAWDAKASELYVVDSGNGVVDVFNDNGMVVYSFGDSAVFGRVAGVALLTGGEPLILGVDGETWQIIRCNFRGEPVGKIELRDVPKAFAENFHPGSIYVARDHIYLADRAAMKVLLLALDGAYETSFEMSRMLGIPAEKAPDEMMRGFSVDRDGNMLFTVATLFQAFVVSPEGSLRGFGQKGSLPGKFNIVGGIVADDDGHIFVTDTLRCVVMAFDRETFRFLGEFGSRGRTGGNLINPLEIAVGNGRVYVTQSVGTVKAFGVQFE